MATVYVESARAYAMLAYSPRPGEPERLLLWTGSSPTMNVAPDGVGPDRTSLRDMPLHVVRGNTGTFTLRNAVGRMAEVTTADIALAMAVLQGDREAALLLADKVLHDYDAASKAG